MEKIDLVTIAEATIIEFSPELIDINTDEQLYEKGIDSLGQSLQEYTAFTKQIKRQKGQPTDRTTLKDTGDFYDAFKLDSKTFPFGVTSTDPKTEELEFKYGEEIFGLTEENEKEYLTDPIEPALLDKAEAEILSAFDVLQ